MTSLAVSLAQDRLRELGGHSSLEELLRIISSVVPFAAGFIDTFPEHAPWQTIQTSILMPPELFQSLLARNPEEAKAVLSLVIAAPTGTCVTDAKPPKEMSWEKAEGYQSLQKYGLGHAAALKLSATSRGAREHTHLALLRDADAPPVTDEEALAIGQLHEQIRSAIERLALPLLESDRLLLPLYQDRTLGIILLDQAGHVLEANRAAAKIVASYRSLLNNPRELKSGAEALLLLEPDTSNDRRRLRHVEEPDRWLEVSVQHLDANSYGLKESCTLVLLQESALLRRDLLAKLTDGERRIVQLMINRGMKLPEIATHLNISYFTVRTHMQNVRAKLGVQSLPALTALLLRPLRIPQD